MTDEIVAEVAAEWAVVEVFGHRRHYGRVSEVERFGAKFLRIEIIGTASDEPIQTLDYAGTAIFSLTPMTEAAARAWAERDRPRAYEPLALMPPEMRPQEFAGDYGHHDDDDEMQQPILRNPLDDF